ncbi:hypothetical protein [Agrococcus sp. DT81.2]|uniref:hypothetical protein n=1 Tax=Agrococcus sp. DT81.2 TaxID=3393414 RepID=UPI003CE478FB
MADLLRALVRRVRQARERARLALPPPSWSDRVEDWSQGVALARIGDDREFWMPYGEPMRSPAFESLAMWRYGLAQLDGADLLSPAHHFDLLCIADADSLEWAPIEIAAGVRALIVDRPVDDVSLSDGHAAVHRAALEERLRARPAGDRAAAWLRARLA